jgi:hypothetical protein
MHIDGPPRVVTYRGFNIHVTDEYRFIVSGKDWPEKGQDKFQSLDSARAAIDDLLATIAKREKIAGTLRIPCLTSEGKRVVVKGFHQNTGEALTVADGPYRYNLFPDEEWIWKLLDERLELLTRVTAIDSKLQPFRVSGQVTYGRTDLARYDEKLETFVNLLRHAAKGAKALIPDNDKPPLTGVSGGQSDQVG